ncbi:hypothetical protein H2198_006151 [Neophaeococcomyces mojaviensis]|uniref:Uncharacterized protein n=1 Tax=Neophaeococcomyces mojaviensis TaxID=3383035 RepID=A0ACC3A3L2_9EURO|nr:hypothetical protein H2198_006151 [Knufia sp. JES_112]
MHFIVALKKCDKGHPLTGSHEADQRICWRQCHRQAVRDATDDWQQLSLCSVIGADREAYIPVVDENALSIRTVDTCETCQRMNHSPEVQGIQADINEGIESVQSIQASIRDLREERNNAQTQEDVSFLDRAIEAERLLLTRNENSIAHLQVDLVNQKMQHRLEGEVDFVMTAVNKMHATARAGEGVPWPCVYFGSQRCEREQRDPERAGLNDWPRVFPPPSKIEGYVEVHQLAIVPLTVNTTQA